MVPVRKLFVLFVSLILAFLLTELTVRYIIGYPRYFGAKTYYIDSDLGAYSYLKWRSPYYEQYSVEGGARKVRFNNLGLPGMDLNPLAMQKPVFLMGDSFVEASQYNGDKIAAGVLQNRLDRLSHDYYGIFNLGSSNHDPYLLWYRSSFYERFFTPDRVVLVYVSFHHLQAGLARWPEPLDFSLDSQFGKEIHKNKYLKIIDKIRSYSSLLTLLSTMIKKSEQPLVTENQGIGHKEALSADETLVRLSDCLNQFKTKYGDKFYFISLMNDNPLNDELEAVCQQSKINYRYNGSIMNPDNLINGGHLNMKGNQVLGDYLFDIISTSVNVNTRHGE